MNNDQVKDRGRRLLVEFTCGRCGAVDYASYASNPGRSDRNNMMCTKPPMGWFAASGYMPLLCPKCAAEHQQFMSRTDSDLHMGREETA